VFLTRESEFASLVIRNPTQAQIDAVCNPAKIGNCNQPIAAILDNRFRNLAGVRTRGLDATAEHTFETSAGKWNLGMNGTYTFDIKQQITATAPVFDAVDTVGNPLKLRLVGHVAWSMQGWTILTTINYSGGYRDIDSVPARRVESWTTVDLNVGYRVEAGTGWFAHTQCNLGVNNLLDQRPPFVNQFDLTSRTLGYGAANASLVGREVSLQAVKKWGQ
jgi:iron complex outermembrane recepter protein